MLKTIVLKRCSRCKEEKPLSEFWKRSLSKDGLQVWCKACLYQRNKEISSTPNGKEARKRYDQSPKSKAAKKRYIQSPKGRKAACRGRKIYDAKYPQRARARDAVKKAIKYGRLQKPFLFMCHNVQCQEPAKEYHHWHGYGSDHWLDIIPMCIPCHRKAHVTYQ